MFNRNTENGDSMFVLFRLLVVEYVGIGMGTVVVFPELSVTLKFAPVTFPVTGSVDRAIVRTHPAGIIFEGRFMMVCCGGSCTPSPLTGVGGYQYWGKMKARLPLTTIRYWSQ
jgi:hypothetical protein